LDAIFQAFETPVMAVLIVMAIVVIMFTVLLFSMTSRDKRFIAHLTKIERSLNNLLSIYRGQDELSGYDRSRDEFVLSLRGMGDSITRLAADITQSQQSQLGMIADHLNRMKNENDRLTVEMRAIADEQMGELLDRRLNKNFQNINNRLDHVYSGLDDMQTGFAAITPEKLSADVWEMLDSAYGEITQFAGALARTQKKLRQASESIEDATRKSRVIEKRLISAPKFHKTIKKT
jgi:DNA anti-recombination protein RmuC